MKTYKTWEVFKILTENPKLEFISKIDESSNDDKYVKLKVGEYILTEILHKEWILFQKPVTFMEAVKAYQEGKNLKLVNSYDNGNEREHFFKDEKSEYLTNELRQFIDTEGNPINCKDILHGKWYIED